MWAPHAVHVGDVVMKAESDDENEHFPGPYLFLRCVENEQASEIQFSQKTTK